MTDELLSAALEYAALGWRVVPLHTVHRGVCSCHQGKKCPEKSRGKHPRLSSWQTAATTDEEQIIAWWTKWPNANVGVVLGEASGLIDIETDSPQEEAELVMLFGGDPPPTCCFTSGRGKHWLFRWRNDLPGGAVVHFGHLGIRTGNDSKGAQSVFPPSIHHSGSRYTWVCSPSEIEPAVLPDEVVARLFNMAGESLPKAGSNGEARKPAVARPGNRDRRFELAVAAMLRMDMSDGNDGSKRLYAAACRAVEFDLADSEAVAAVRAYEGLKPFPTAWSDADILNRVRDAEKKQERGEALQKEGTITDESGKPADAENDRPTIVVGVDETRVVNQAIAALSRRDDLYQRGGLLCEVVNDEGVAGVRMNGNCRIAAVRLPRLQEMLADAATWKQYSIVDGKKTPGKCHPPAWAVKAVDARGQWRGVRPLTGMIETPTVRPDGSVLQEPGYDPQTGLVFRPSCEYPTIPAKPSRDEAQRAVEALLEVVQDFPFASAVHRSAWLAFVLTLVGRESFDGCAPLTLVDANTRGSGKSLLVDVASIIATGRGAPRMTFPRDEDELRKRITSVVMAGLRLVMIDNTTRLGGDALDAALTATTWQDRILGRSEITTLPISMTWCATGNNVQVLGDTIRRVLPVRIETREEMPEERTGFRHPDLRAWVAAERGRLAAAAVTILAGYAAAGRPDMRLTPWGSFEGWSAIIRSAVVWAGQADPAGNRRELMSAADTEGGLRRRLLAGWAEIDPSGRGLTAGEALRRLAEFPHEFEALRSALEEITPPGKPLSVRTLGMKFHHFRGRVVGGRCFDCREVREGMAWRVVSVEADGGGSQPTDCGTSGTSGTKLNPTHASESRL